MNLTRIQYDIWRAVRDIPDATCMTVADVVGISAKTVRAQVNRRMPKGVVRVEHHGSHDMRLYACDSAAKFDIVPDGRGRNRFGLGHREKPIESSNRRIHRCSDTEPCGNRPAAQTHGIRGFGSSSCGWV